MAKGYLFIILTSLFCIIGCAHKVCTDPTDCWKGYMHESACGTYIQQPCDNICLACTFNEPVCQACWNCVHHDGCGFDGSTCNIMNWK